MNPDRPGRVLLVHGTAEHYGADRSLLTLTRGLHERGWRVEVLVGEPGPLVPLLREAGAEVSVAEVAIFRRVFSPARWLRYVFVEFPAAVWRIARRARSADVVHLNTSVLPAAAIGGWLARRPVVMHMRESYADDARIWRWYARVLRPFLAAVVAISEAVAAEAREAGLRSITHVVNNGLDLGVAPERRHPEGPVVMAGRINSWKGQPVLVEAAAILAARGEPIPILIAGDVFPGGEKYREALVADIAARGVAGQVELLGFVPDMGGLLGRASIFVLPSVRPEPFGLALIEAMAAALPVVATAHGGPREIVRHERTGLLVPPGDASALADALARLWADPALRERLGAAAAQDVRVRFGADRMVDGVVRVYAQVAR